MRTIGIKGAAKVPVGQKYYRVQGGITHGNCVGFYLNSKLRQGAILCIMEAGEASPGQHLGNRITSETQFRTIKECTEAAL